MRTTAAQAQAHIDAINATLLKLYQRLNRDETLGEKRSVRQDIQRLEGSLDYWENRLAGISGNTDTMVARVREPGT